MQHKNGTEARITWQSLRPWDAIVRQGTISLGGLRQRFAELHKQSSLCCLLISDNTTSWVHVGNSWSSVARSFAIAVLPTDEVRPHDGILEADKLDAIRAPFQYFKVLYVKDVLAMTMPRMLPMLIPPSLDLVAETLAKLVPKYKSYVSASRLWWIQISTSRIQRHSIINQTRMTPFSRRHRSLPGKHASTSPQLQKAVQAVTKQQRRILNDDKDPFFFFR